MRSTPVAQARPRHQHADEHHRQHERHHQKRVRQQAVEHAFNGAGIQPLERARAAEHHERQHPPGHRGVEHHQQVVARKRHPFEPMPFRPRRLQLVEAARDALLACAPHGELHNQDGQREHHEEQQVHEHERRAAVLSRYIGEAPHVPQPDGAPCADQDEPESGSEFFSSHVASLYGKAPCVAAEGACEQCEQCNGKPKSGQPRTGAGAAWRTYLLSIFEEKTRLSLPRRVFSSNMKIGRGRPRGKPAAPRRPTRSSRTPRSP